MTSAVLASSAVPRQLAALNEQPALFLTPHSATRFWEFFTANIRNKNTRRAYFKAVCRFSTWCETRGLGELAAVAPIHVAAYVEEMQLSPFATVDQAAPGRAQNAVRLASGRPGDRVES